MSPPCPYLSSPINSLPAVVTPGVLSPRGNSATPGVLVPCGNSTPPPTPWRYPRGFSTTLEALLPPSSSPTPGDLWATTKASRPLSSPRTSEDSLAGFSCRPASLPLCSGLAAWRPPAPTLPVAADEAFLVLTPPAIASPKRLSALLSGVPPAVSVRGSLSHSIPSAVVASSFVAKPSESSPLHPALSSALSP